MKQFENLQSTMYAVTTSLEFLKMTLFHAFLKASAIFFGIRNTDVFVGLGSENVLTQMSTSEYILNLYENGNYIPMRFSFKGNKLTVSYFEYDDGTSHFNFIETQKSIPTQYNELVILSPTAEEFKTLTGKGIFALEQTFKRK